MKHIQKKNYLMKQIETTLGGDIEEILRRLFVDENKSMHTIAKELHISYATLNKWLLLAGIHSRKLTL